MVFAAACFVLDMTQRLRLEKLAVGFQLSRYICKGRAMTDSQCNRCGEVNPAEIHTCTPKQEPVMCDCDSPAWCKQYKKCHRAMLGFEPYVAPPQREWQGLTDEEVFAALVAVDGNTKRLAPGFVAFYCAIEAKLKEKNG